MGLVNQIEFAGKAFRSLRFRRTADFLAIMDGARGHVSTLFSNTGDVRFSSRTVFGELERYVLLYAETRGSGIYDIAATWENQYDSGERLRMKIGVLDHIPLSGEHVVGWIP